MLSFRDLLTVFFTIHDPTTLNRQGNDVGTQYRSVMFCQTPAQRAIAEDVIRTLTAEKLFRGKIVTEVADAAPFYPAESYHQDYFERNGNQPYCMCRRAQGRQVPQVVHRAAEAPGVGASGL